ncbi:MAG: hypothetical protein QM778_12125 [Myxococcales bacterium]
MALSLSAGACEKRRAPTVRPPELVAQSPRSTAPAGPNPQAPTPTLAHALLGLEGHYLRDCNGLESEQWLATRKAALDRLLDAVDANIAALSGRAADWGPAGVEQALRSVDQALYASGYAVCVETERLGQTFSDPIPYEGSARMRVSDNVCQVHRSLPYRDVALRGRRALHPFDCDLGAVLYMSSAARHDWPLVLVEVPKHNFVRWVFADGTHFNWDVNIAESVSDQAYRAGQAGPAFDAIQEREAGYLQGMSERAVLGYYVSLLISQVTSDVCLLEAKQSLQARRNLEPSVANALAWALATRPALASPAHSADAIALAERAVRESPFCTYWQTLSCAYAAAGDLQRAIHVERHHVSPDSPRIEHYRAGRNCYQEDVARSRGCD